MVRHTLKILQQMLQDFKNVSDHFRTLCIKGLNSKVKSQFSYCSLIWMIPSRYSNNAFNGIQERILRLIYNLLRGPF